MTCCPNCGFHHGVGGYAEELSASTLPGLQRRILQRLAKARGAFVQRELLINTLYGDRIDGPPDAADASVPAMVSRLKRAIEPYGWTIEAIKFTGYRLVRKSS